VGKGNTSKRVLVQNFEEAMEEHSVIPIAGMK